MIKMIRVVKVKKTNTLYALRLAKKEDCSECVFFKNCNLDDERAKALLCKNTAGNGGWYVWHNEGSDFPEDMPDAIAFDVV